MLTKKEGLPFNLRKGQLLPKFVSLEDPEALEYAGFISEILSQALSKRQGQIEEELAELKESFEPTPFRMGLHKICLDKLDFNPPTDFLGSPLRQEVFQEAFALPKAGLTPEQFRQEIQKRLKKEAPLLLYGDLPSEHVVGEVPTAYRAQDLLNAYNVGLVQGLLLYAPALSLKIPSSEKPHLRQLVRFAKFFKLILSVEHHPDDSFSLVFDGPLSVLQHGSRYGFQLASFFPIVLNVPCWELHAEIKQGAGPRQQGKLVVNHQSGLLPYQRNYSAYIPEDYLLFEQHFNEKSTSWKIKPESAGLLFDGQEYFVPDFELLSPEGELAYLELFHPWHKAPLMRRLAALEKYKPPFTLIVGVSQKLLGEEDSLGQDFQRYGFLFREIPTVKALLYALSHYNNLGRNNVC